MSATACALFIQLAAFHASGDYRTFTPGAGAVCERGAMVATAGAFSNSIGRLSAYAALGVEPVKVGPVRLGVVAGLINGYAYRNGGAFPFAGLVATVPVSSVNVRIMVLPRSKVSPVTFALGVTL